MAVSPSLRAANWPFGWYVVAPALVSDTAPLRPETLAEVTLSASPSGSKSLARTLKLTAGPSSPTVATSSFAPGARQRPPARQNSPPGQVAHGSPPVPQAALVVPGAQRPAAVQQPSQIWAQVRGGGGGGGSLACWAACFLAFFRHFFLALPDFFLHVALRSWAAASSPTGRPARPSAAVSSPPRARRREPALVNARARAPKRESS